MRLRMALIFATMSLAGLSLSEGARAEIDLGQIDIISSTPLLGSGLEQDKLPASSTTIDAAAISRKGAANALQAAEDEVPGLVLDSASGNPDQPNVMFHGFTASPLQGTSQGLAVYVGGIRFNQAFGDTLNWDLLPNNAIERIDVVGSNPAFGLNALGGALNVKLRDGFSFQGGEAVLSGGSFGQVGGQLQYGVQSGDVAGYIAISGRHEDGWRDLQSSDVGNLYGDVGWRGPHAEMHVSITAADSALNGPGTSPVQLLAADAAAQFTAPNYIANHFYQLALSGSDQISDAWSLQANAYVSRFQQLVRNGNAPSLAPCDDGSGNLCEAPGVFATTTNGQPIADFLNGGQYAQLDIQQTTTTAYGASVQATQETTQLGRPNHLIVGASYDGATTLFSAESYIGAMVGSTRGFAGPAIEIDQADGSIAPVRVRVDTAYEGLFAVDSFDLTDRLTITGSARLNLASVDLHDQIGTALNGSHDYARLNPALGLSYRLAPQLSFYAGYAETNRAPTPAELSCASAAAPCSLANFFVGDPALKQVVAHSVELGLRGHAEPHEGAKLSYHLGLFHSSLNDDIVFVTSPVQGRAFFQNVGRTYRQGVDAGVKLDAGRLTAFLNYSYTLATFGTGFVEASGNNPAADGNGNISIRSGNQLPGVPNHVAKAGAEYRLTDAWTVGLNGIGNSGSYLYGDEANLTAKLPGYVRLDFATRYDLGSGVMLFGLVENLTNARYYTFGTFSPTSSVTLVQAPGASNPRSYAIAAPVGGVVGVRVRF